MKHLHNGFRFPLFFCTLLLLGACTMSPTGESAVTNNAQPTAEVAEESTPVAEATTPSAEEETTEGAEAEEAATVDSEDAVVGGQSAPAAPVAGNNPLPYEITLPPGFRIDIYADNVPNARSMALGPDGTLVVGTRSDGRLYALRDTNADYQADEVHTLASDMNMPNGVAFRDGSLYVAEVDRVLRYDNIAGNLASPPEPVVVSDEFPSDTHHGWKYIAFGPDDKLYVPVGAPCNICDTEEGPYSKIWRMNPDGSELEVFAEGMRNTVGFDWHPVTGELWWTDNGGDNLGDDVPPDELNRSPEPGMHFGYPYCHGGTVLDPEFGDQRSCDEFTPPAQALGPHVAALGMTFYTGAMFPEEYHNQVFIPEHGSWNRSVPIGYRITLVRLNENSEATSYEVFAEGWLAEDGTVHGRPVDLLVMPDGSMLVSDDEAGMIYRISYQGDS